MDGKVNVDDDTQKNLMALQKAANLVIAIVGCHIQIYTYPYRMPFTSETSISSYFVCRDTNSFCLSIYLCVCVCVYLYIYNNSIQVAGIQCRILE